MAFGKGSGTRKWNPETGKFEEVEQEEVLSPLDVVREETAEKFREIGTTRVAESERKKKAALDRLKPPTIDSLAEAARIRAIIARMQFAPAGRSATIATSPRGITGSASLVRQRLTGV